MEEYEKIELRSDEVQEILSRPPHSLVRYGISLIFAVFFIALIGCFFFKYPDVVTGEVVITTENPPVWLVAKSTGKIKELFCRDKEYVKSNMILGVLENTASTKDVNQISNLIQKTTINDSVCNLPVEFLEKIFELGVIQNSFSSFQRAAISYKNFVDLNINIQEGYALTEQMKKRKNYASNLKDQYELKNKELMISKLMFERDKKLFDQNVISASDFQVAEQAYLSKQQEIIQLKTTISSENVETIQLKSSITKLSLEYLQKKKELLSNLKTTFRELVVAIDNWKEAYLLVASESGVVTFSNFWKKNQYVNAGDKVFAIVSSATGKLVGKIKVASAGFGKVKPGQLVNIKVADFPYLEYGLLKARVTNISLISNNNYYYVEVEFPQGLLSTINKQIRFTGELKGTAEIITDDRTLVNRILSPIKMLLKKSID